MSTLTYTRLEVLRTFRNTRFFILSLAFPLVLFYTVAGSNRHVHIGGISFPLYYMVGMASWGAMAAVMAGGARIALERSVGWTRQMKITPLSTFAYFRSKVLSGYLIPVFGFWNTAWLCSAINLLPALLAGRAQLDVDGVRA